MARKGCNGLEGHLLGGCLAFDRAGGTVRDEMVRW